MVSQNRLLLVYYTHIFSAYYAQIYKYITDYEKVKKFKKLTTCKRVSTRRICNKTQSTYNNITLRYYSVGGAIS